MNKAIILLSVVVGLTGANAQKNVNHDSISAEMQALQRVDYPVFKPGERIEYLVHYGFVHAGKATIEVKEKPVKIKGKDSYHVIGKGVSTGTFDFFFKVRDTYQSFIDTDNLHPHLFLRDVNEGGYKKVQNYHFHQDENYVKSNKGDSAFIPTGIQDMISAFYFARTLDLTKYKEGDVIVIYAYVDGELEPVKMRYVGKEKIKAKAGTFNTLKFQPIVQKGRVFNDPEDLTVYVTDDKNKIPVLAKAKILVGSVKMQLTDFENLAHPVAKVD